MRRCATSVLRPRISFKTRRQWQLAVVARQVGDSRCGIVIPFSTKNLSRKTAGPSIARSLSARRSHAMALPLRSSQLARPSNRFGIRAATTGTTRNSSICTAKICLAIGLVHARSLGARARHHHQGTDHGGGKEAGARAFRHEIRLQREEHWGEDLSSQLQAVFQISVVKIINYGVE